MEVTWRHYVEIKMLMKKYGLLNLDQKEYEAAIRELLEILQL